MYAWLVLWILVYSATPFLFPHSTLRQVLLCAFSLPAGLCFLPVTAHLSDALFGYAGLLPHSRIRWTASPPSINQDREIREMCDDQQVNGSKIWGNCYGTKKLELFWSEKLWQNNAWKAQYIVKWIDNWSTLAIAIKFLTLEAPFKVIEWTQIREVLISTGHRKTPVSPNIAEIARKPKALVHIVWKK